MLAVFRDLIRYNIEFTIGLILVGIMVVFASLSFSRPTTPP
jgi:peptide/nickel transport system permease protein